MATEQQILNMMRKMREIHPGKAFRHMSDTTAGIGAVLKLLYTADTPVTAGMISKKLNISTARVAVLLKKMSAKGLVQKEKDPHDARITRVELTNHGRSTIETMWKEIKDQMGKVIDEIGEEKLLEYIAISKKIKQIVSKPKQFSELE